jgi:hypothetical protein
LVAPKQIQMRTVDRFSVLSVALLNALGDSIDEALNRFHIENMMGQITSDISSEVSSSQSSKSEKKTKVKDRAKVHNGSNRSSGSERSSDKGSSLTYTPSAAVTAKVTPNGSKASELTPKSLMFKRQRFLKLGVDLKRVQLTDTGFKIS